MNLNYLKDFEEKKSVTYWTTTHACSTHPQTHITSHLAHNCTFQYTLPIHNTLRVLL